MSVHHPASLPSTRYSNPTPHLDPSLNPHFSLSARPTCPSILIPFEGRLYALPIHSLSVVAEFNVSTAFIKITGTWKNIASYTSDCMFVLPLNGTVTECNISIDSRIFETIIIPTDEAIKMKSEMEESGIGMSGFAYGTLEQNEAGEGQLPQGQLPPMSYEEYIPNLFRLPIASVASTDLINVSCIYIEPLPFLQSSYDFTLPLSFGPNLIPPGKTMNDILSIKAIINSVTLHTRYESTSHQMAVVKREWPRIELEVVEFEQRKNAEYLASLRERERNRLNNPNGSPNSADITGVDSNSDDEYFASASVDFQLSYSMTTNEILATFIKETKRKTNRSHSNQEAEDSEGNFLLFVTPPSIENVNIFFVRNLVFLLDRSGSMSGDPYHEATRALTVALSNLKPGDQFTIVAFDHRQEVFSHELVPVNNSNIGAAATWIKTIQPQKGGTDIQTPLEWALDLLQISNSSHAQTLPFVILLTDGCVSNERDICKFTARHIRTTRILTFGIGSYCNWFFLKMLAQIGRGFSDVVVYREKIYSQMLQLLNMCAVPVVTDIRLEMTGGLKQVELYPFPIPDLFMGAPLTISGKYIGELPEQVQLIGLTADKSIFRVAIRPRTSDVIPVNRVFIKQRLDLLTARAWLEESKKLTQEVIELSCAESMPSAFTMMVAYETNEEKKAKLDEELDALERAERGDDYDFDEKYDEFDERAENDHGDVDEDGHPRKRPPLPSEINRRKMRRWYRNKKTIAALAVGNLMVIGAAAFSFGDVGGTLGNIPVIGDVLGAFDTGCCEHCGECDCACIHECSPC